MRLITALFLALTMQSVSSAQERILSFESEILVIQDGWIEVTETIQVVAEGDRMRRGIYRDFPTEYRDRLGNDYSVDFQPISLLRNGAREDYHTKALRHGTRTYFGKADRLLEHGEHTYVFRYRASRMLGFFDNHDELYWNVTGFDWAFPIETASAKVAFDFDVASGDLGGEAYTGPYGSQAQDATSRVDNKSVHFVSDGALSPVHGLTIIVSWPKGLVVEPSRTQRLKWLLADNSNLLAALIGWIVLLGYFIPTWSRHGRDPKEGVIFTRYEPPPGYSAASLRYVRQMYYDNKSMTTGIVSLAVKGYLRIYETSGSYLIQKATPDQSPPPLATGEQELYSALFESGDRVKLENENHAVIGRAKSAHQQSLRDDYKNHYFKTNVSLLIPAAVIVVATLGSAFALNPEPSVIVIVVIALMVLTTAFFGFIMRRPTQRGRKLLDEMLGFKDYLEVAEKNELNLRNPPKRTPELFEKYLPFALALGVEQAWSERFAAVIAAIQGPTAQHYHPSWYAGNWSAQSFGTSLNTLSSGLNTAVSSSVTPPGSSSGSGGGGFSGGGGGGGGGGGW